MGHVYNILKKGIDDLTIFRIFLTIGQVVMPKSAHQLQVGTHAYGCRVEGQEGLLDGCVYDTAAYGTCNWLSLRFQALKYDLSPPSHLLIRYLSSEPSAIRLACAGGESPRFKLCRIGQTLTTPATDVPPGRSKRTSPSLYFLSLLPFRPATRQSHI